MLPVLWGGITEVRTHRCDAAASAHCRARQEQSTHAFRLPRSPSQDTMGCIRFTGDTVTATRIASTTGGHSVRRKRPDGPQTCAGGAGSRSTPGIEGVICGWPRTCPLVETFLWERWPRGMTRSRGKRPPDHHTRPAVS